MKNLIRRIADNPAAFFGLATALLGLLVIFHVPLTKEEIGGITVLLGALVTFIQRYIMPKRKVVTRVTNAGRIVAGEASTQQTDTTVKVLPDPHTGAPVPQAAVNPELLK